MITLRSRILIALTVLAGAGVFAVWHWLSANPCVDDSTLDAPAIIRSAVVISSAPASLLRVQDDNDTSNSTNTSNSDDGSVDSSDQPDEIPCQSDMLNRNSERAASGLFFLVLLGCSVASVASDRRAARRHRWSRRLMRGQGGQR